MCSTGWSVAGRKVLLPIDHLDLFSKFSISTCIVTWPIAYLSSWMFSCLLATAYWNSSCFFKWWVLYAMLNILTSSFRTTLPHLKHLLNWDKKLGTWLMIGNLRFFTFSVCFYLIRPLMICLYMQSAYNPLCKVQKWSCSLWGRVCCWLLPAGFKYLSQIIHPGGNHLMQINLVLTKCVEFLLFYTVYRRLSISQFARMRSHLHFPLDPGILKLNHLQRWGSSLSKFLWSCWVHLL